MDSNESKQTSDVLFGGLALLLAAILAPFLAQLFIKSVLAGDVKSIAAETFNTNTCVMSRDGGVFVSKESLGTEFYLTYTTKEKPFDLTCYRELVEDMEKKTNRYSILQRSPDFALIHAGSETYQFTIPQTKELVNAENVHLLFKKYEMEK